MKILIIATLASILLLALTHIGWLIANRIKEWFFKRDMKRDEQMRERRALDERFDGLGKYIGDVRSSLWKLEEKVDELQEQLNNKENKKNVKKKKRN